MEEEEGREHLFPETLLVVILAGMAVLLMAAREEMGHLEFLPPVVALLIMQMSEPLPPGLQPVEAVAEAVGAT